MYKIQKLVWKHTQRWDRKDWSYRQVSLQLVGWHFFIKQDCCSCCNFRFSERYFTISPHCTVAPVAVPGHCTLARDVTHTARHGVLPNLYHDLQILQRNLPLCSVLYNVLWRLWPVVKNVDWQWRNGWCLMRRNGVKVASQVLVFWFQHLM